MPFLLTAIASFIPAQLIYRLCPAHVDSTRSVHAMLIAALSWAAIPLIGTIPFWGVATVLNGTPEFASTTSAFQNGWNALFESFSGFTGTGLSMTQNASELPHSLQWWRSLAEWIDGVGVIVLVLAVLEPEVDANDLYTAEGRQKTKVKPNHYALQRDSLAISMPLVHRRRFNTVSTGWRGYD